MKFTPDNYETFWAEQRETLAQRIACKKSTAGQLRMLRKISIRQLLSREIFPEPVDAREYTDRLFGTCVLRFLKSGRQLSTKLSGSGICMLDAGMYEGLVLELLLNGYKSGAASAEFVIEYDLIKLKIAPVQISSAAAELIKKLDGKVYYTPKSKSCGVLLPVTPAAEIPGTEVADETQRLRNPFAAVNYFFL